MVAHVRFTIGERLQLTEPVYDSRPSQASPSYANIGASGGHLAAVLNDHVPVKQLEGPQWNTFRLL